MITRIELDGFKTFQDFSLDLAPLQVIVGANGAGKSNLFDALRLLGRFAGYGPHLGLPRVALPGRRTLHNPSRRPQSRPECGSP